MHSRKLLRAILFVQETYFKRLLLVLLLRLACLGRALVACQRPIHFDDGDAEPVLSDLGRFLLLGLRIHLAVYL